MTTLSIAARQIFTRLSALLEKIRGNRRISVLINAVLAVFLAIYLYNFFSSEYQQINQLKIQLTWQPLLISLLIYGLNYGLFMISWHLLLKGYRIQIPFLSNIEIYSYSQVAKILPTPAWFIANRIIRYNKEGERKRLIFSASLAEIILHMLIGFLILLLVRISPENPLSYLYLLAVTPAIVLSLKPNPFFKLFHKSESFSFTPSGMAAILMLFVFTWISGGVFFEQILSGCGQTSIVPWGNLYAIWILSSLVAYIGSITLGGFGVLREFSITLLLSSYMPPPISLLVASVSRVVMTVGNIIWPLMMIGICSIYENRVKIEPPSNSKDEG